MSRILEFQGADEQTVVARVLLELHQAIDSNFPDAKGSSRQFTKTVLSSRSENTAIDQQPGQASSPSPPQHQRRERESGAQQGQNAAVAVAARQEFGSSLEFSRADSSFGGLTATALEEAPWSRWFTRILVLSLFIGSVLLAWIYLFGAPKF